MKKALVLLALAFTSASLACPVKQGYMLNGLIKGIPKELKPDCDNVAKAVIRFSISGNKAQWEEIYRAANGKVAYDQANLVASQLVDKYKYELEGKKPMVGGATLFVFSKGTKAIVIRTAKDDGVLGFFGMDLPKDWKK